MQDTIQFMHIPLNMGRVVTRMMKKVEEADDATELGDFLMLAYDPSPWKSEIHVSVTKDVPGGKMVRPLRRILQQGLRRSLQCGPQV